METEFETRFLEVNKGELLEKLRKLGAEDCGEFKLEEVIFYDKDLNWLDENKFVRLRQKGNSIKLTYKNNKEQTADSAKEIEFEIKDMDKAREFLEIMGLVAYRIVEKYRHTFKFKNVTLDIDTWPKIPTYVEFEGNSVEDLKNVSEELGFNWDERYDKDARYVFKKYGYDFDKIRSITFDKFE